MSTEFRTPTGPPWTVDDIADVHAGVYPPELTLDLLARIRLDPEGAAVLDALDATIDDLSLLPPIAMPEKYVLRLDAALERERQTAAATRPIARERLGALLAPGAAGPGHADLPRPVLPGPRPAVLGAVAPGGPTGTVPQRHQPVIPAVLPGRPPTPPPSTTPPAGPPSGPPERSAVGDLAAARERRSAAPLSAAAPASRLGSLEAQRRTRRRWTTGLLAAAAVIVAGTVTAVALTGNGSTTPGLADSAPTTQQLPGAQPSVTVPNGSNAAARITIDPADPGKAVGQFTGAPSEGVLGSLAQYSACLTANGIDPSSVEGASAARFNGQDAVAFLVRTADSGTARLVVVKPSCGTTSAADKLADETVQR